MTKARGVSGVSGVTGVTGVKGVSVPLSVNQSVSRSVNQ